MLSVERCKKYLEGKNVTDKRAEEIRDYLYAISREIIKNNIANQKQNTKIYEQA